MYETKEERDALFRATLKYSEVELLNKVATGFGWAVLVRDDLEMQMHKVVKLPNSEHATRELQAEAEILVMIRQLHHPNLIELYSVERYRLDWNGKNDERWLISLQYGGENLRSRLGRLGMKRVKGDETYVYLDGKVLPVDEVFDIARQLAAGLRALHEFEVRGEHIVHRDIKPENILIDKQRRVRITDFGISRVVERLTQSMTLGGTPPYFAPESSRGRISAASDVYSLGIVLYEMATGKFPFRLQEDKLWELPEPPARVNPSIPAALSDVIMRALDWDPRAERGAEIRNRYRHGGELLEDLERCHRRLHPVPAEYERIAAVGSGGLYREKASRREVRIFVYETRQPAICLTRLAALSNLRLPNVLLPLRAIDAEGTICVVAPSLRPQGLVDAATVDYQPGPATGGSTAMGRVADAGGGSAFLFEPVPPPRDSALAAGPSAVCEGAEAAAFLQRLSGLCGQLAALHAAGVCHGAVAPQTVFHGGQGWVIDRAWLGAFAGAADRAALIPEGDPLLDFLAPEMRGWTAPPSSASDVYGVGALAYFGLAGRPPRTMKAADWSLSAGDWVVHDDGADPGRQVVAWPRAVPRRWALVISRALHADPSRRQQSLPELEAELARCRWPDDAVAALVDQARAEFRQGRSVEAYDLLDAAQRLDPGSPAVHHARAECFFADGGYEFALEENKAAYDIDPNPAVCFLQAECLLQLNDLPAALALAKEGLAQRDGARGRRLLGTLLVRTGRKEEGLKELEAALRIAERNRENEELERIHAQWALVSEQPPTTQFNPQARRFGEGRAE